MLRIKRKCVRNYNQIFYCLHSQDFRQYLANDERSIYVNRELSLLNEVVLFHAISWKSNRNNRSGVHFIHNARLLFNVNSLVVHL
jgi:hypothetical protein